MAYEDLRDYLQALKKHDELARVTSEVSPILEITEVADRAVKKGGPALLFERPKGYDTPVAINLFGSERRMALAPSIASAPEASRS